MNNIPTDGVCQFYLFAVAVAFAAFAALIFSTNGFGLGFWVLCFLCGVCLWAAVFASARVRGIIASIFSSGV